MNDLFQPIARLKGIGEKRSQSYARLGIETPYHLLYHLPRSYIDFSQTVAIADTIPGEPAALCLTIAHKLPPQRIRAQLTIYKAIATDGTSDITLLYYNTPYTFDALRIGATYYIYGKVTGNLLRREITAPRSIPGNSKQKILPVYPLTTGLTAGRITADLQKALQLFQQEPFEWMPEQILAEHHLMSLTDAIPQIHFPATMEHAALARRRLAFDELLQLQLGMALYRSSSRSKTAYCIPAQPDLQPFYAALPFTMTGGQQQAVREICTDLSRNVPMNRLLQGDVGSGKTVVAAAACYCIAANGMQCALMAPTEILATQHFHTLSSFLEPLGIQVGLLTGSTRAKQRRQILADAAEGTLQVLVGTHALFQKDVTFRKLALVITDEQHRFGVAQRTQLAEKGGVPHKLVMSATPIPRTLALLLYGDLDLSVLRESPKGRMPIETYAVTGKLRERSYRFLQKELDAGHQAYIVCPMIEESESDLQAVTAYAADVQAGAFAAYRVGLLHGKMKPAEKDAVMQAFQAHELDLLVCTTVVEVGIDVPNATVLLIENAERFGLSQLHQLRGRVGRGTSQSYCILMTDHVTDDCRKRLQIMSQTTDGFRIAEEDLKQRGPGDFFGQRQHGLPPLKIADLSSDMELFSETQQLAQEILQADPQLRQPQHHALHLEVLRLFAKAGANGMN